MKNKESVQRVPKKTSNLHFLIARIPYNNSLTLVKTYPSKMGEKKLVAYFNQPKDDLILADLNSNYSKYASKRADYLDKLNLSSKGFSHYNAFQAFDYNQPTFVLKDMELFETYPALKENWQESLVFNSPITSSNPPKIMTLSEEELVNLYFPYANHNQVLVMDMQGNIYKRPNDLLPSQSELLQRYKEHLLNQIIAMQRLVDDEHQISTFITNFHFLKQFLAQDNLKIPEEFPITPNLLVFKILEDQNLQIQKLEINYLAPHKFLVKAYNLFFPIYEDDYLNYIKNKTW